jgi:regulator of sigma E protease
VVDKVLLSSPAASAGLRAGDEVLRIDDEPVRDQTDATLGLLDAVTSDGEARIDVRGSDGRERSVTLSVPDEDQRHRLTEPAKLYSGLGFQFWMPRFPAVVGGVIPEGPAARAGLKAGDQIIAIDGAPIRSYQELVDYVNARPAQTMVLTLRRAGGDDILARLTTTRDEIEGRVIGRILIQPPADAQISYPPEMLTRSDLGLFGSLSYSVARSWQLTVTQAKFFWRMLTGKMSTKNISGFISIARVSGAAASSGPSDFLMLLVLLSLSLGFLNLLPIPILDGGQIVFQVVEWAKGAPLSERAQLVGQQAGLLLLVLLMGVALFNDLSGIFAGRG